MKEIKDEVNVRKILGTNLKEIREDHKINQKELADVFHVHEKSLSRAENGHNSASFYLVYQYAQYFNVTVDYLLDEGRKNPAQSKLISALMANEISDETCEILLKIADMLEKKN